ncbi:MAG: Asp/Glu/hydantoin racemase [Geminicoccaceae bacterium]|nr:MAG: Asp/Glu/hydantoin racemase [Geminicoccaceae bacterium]
MNLLLVNPNTTAAITDRLVEEAQRVAAPGTTITGVTARAGFPYIETAAEAMIAAPAALEVIAENLDGHDAVILAAFGDPGLFELKRLLPVPVVGLAEAAMMTASATGYRFGIVSIASRMQAWYQKAVDQFGFHQRCVGFRFLDAPFERIEEVRDRYGERIFALADDLVAEGADSIVFAGAPLAGIAATSGVSLRVPAIDGTWAAVAQAEALARMVQSGALQGLPTTAHGKHSRGLPTPMARLF